MRTFILACALVALASCHKSSQPAGNQEAAAAPEVPTKGVDRTHKGQAELAATFNDPDGKPTSLKAFAGKPTLVNLWASWCAPCIKELPTLDRLAAAKKGQLNVVTVSQDADVPHASVVAFLKAHEVANLGSYQDPKMALSAALGPDTVLPTSILYDAGGHEVWRYVGDQDWTGAGAAKLLAEGGA